MAGITRCQAAYWETIMYAFAPSITTSDIGLGRKAATIVVAMVATQLDS